MSLTLKNVKRIAVKIFKRVCLMGSILFIKRGRRSIRHVILADFDLLVAANEDVGRNILLFRNFEPEEAAFFRKEIQPTDICFDIGGNVGFFTMLMAARAKHGAVHVFEPIPFNAALIQTNALLNEFKNVFVRNFAVGSSSGTAQFSIAVDSAYSSMRSTGRRREESSIAVPVITLDHYVTKYDVGRVDILKVDVEGAEGMVVSGAMGILSNRAIRPRMILLELFEVNLRPFETDVQTIVNEMINHGYSASALIGQKLEPLNVGMINKFHNIIFTSEVWARR